MNVKTETEPQLLKSAARVQDFLHKNGYSFTVKELQKSTRTAQDAADAIGCEVAQIAKSLIFKKAGSEELILVIASGSNTVSLEKIKATTGLTLERADAKNVKRQTGFAIGGIPPVGHLNPLPTFIDRDMLNYDLIWAAAGTPFAVFSITAQELVNVTNGCCIDCAN